MTARPRVQEPIASYTILTLVGLAFLWSTQVVRPESMALLALAASAAPWIRHLRERWWFRLAWMAVMFSLAGSMVRDFLVFGPVELLENGLLLSATCQVHLLHNIGARQKADLLFVNSFVIVMVASFFVQDAVFCLLLLLQLVTMVRALRRRVAPLGPARGTVDAAAEAPLLAAAAGLAVALFVLVPRSFDRHGMALPTLPLMAGQTETGFGSEVRLAGRNRLALDNRVVMVVEPSHASPHAVPSLWRGNTLGVFDGETWHEGALPLPHEGGSAPWRMVSRGGLLSWETKEEPWGPPFAVELREGPPGRLFLPETAAVVQLEGPVLLQPLGDGSLQVPQQMDMRLPVRFQLFLGRQRQARPGGIPERWESYYTRLPSRVSPRVASLAERARRRAGAGAGPRMLAEEVTAILQADHGYLLPGEEGAAASLEEFLAPGGRGHCEFFAAAAALALRQLGVPARLASGFRAGEPEEDGRVLVRRLHAHAWVEALDPEEGWWTLDPTPAVWRSEAAKSWWRQLWRQAADLWLGVLRFDAERRRALLRMLLSPLFLLAAAAVLGMAVGATVLLARRQRAPHPAVRRYLRHTARLRRPWETPRELLARTRDPRLRGPTRAHERSRYAPIR